jgi:hypothetical protein
VSVTPRAGQVTTPNAVSLDILVITELPGRQGTASTEHRSTRWRDYRTSRDCRTASFERSVIGPHEERPAQATTPTTVVTPNVKLLILECLYRPPNSVVRRRIPTIEKLDVVADDDLWELNLLPLDSNNVLDPLIQLAVAVGSNVPPVSMVRAQLVS